MVSLKEIEAWCYMRIDLINRLYGMEEPEGVDLCGLSSPKLIADAKRVHVYEGIDMIAAALKLPVKIGLIDDEYYQKTVTHLGVQFFQLEHYPNIGDEDHELIRTDWPA